jgi:bifunctional oligoribonuclease and PAP phosphatase NrnA
MTTQAQELQQIIESAQDIVIIQADNPDADSLGSALGLEQILGNMGKEPYMYCGIDIPSYLRYLAGWDRVARTLPKKFDAAIFVDVSTMSLIDKITRDPQYPVLTRRPVAVLDHHAVVAEAIEFASVSINATDVSSAGELIGQLAQQLGWPLDAVSTEYLMTAILGDTQGLTNDLARPSTYRLLADFVDIGADRPKLEEKRRQHNKYPPEIFKYKADLIDRTELLLDGALAVVAVPQTEIETYSPLYNPAPLIQQDMMLIDGVRVSVVLKRYDDGKTTAAIRSAYGFPIAAPIAVAFGGGGHAYASGFKLTDRIDSDELRAKLLRATEDALSALGGSES